MKKQPHFLVIPLLLALAAGCSDSTKKGGESDADAGGPPLDAALADMEDGTPLTDAADTPLFEPEPGTAPLWQHTRVIGLFGGDTVADVVVAALRDRLGNEAVVGWHAETLADQAWERTWMDRFEPLRSRRAPAT